MPFTGAVPPAMKYVLHASVTAADALVAARAVTVTAASAAARTIG